MNCKKVETLLNRLSDDEIGERQIHALERHIKVCAVCRERVTAIRRETAAYKAVLRPLRLRRSLVRRVIREIERFGLPVSRIIVRPTRLQKALAALPAAVVLFGIAFWLVGMIFGTVSEPTPVATAPSPPEVAEYIPAQVTERGLVKIFWRENPFSQLYESDHLSHIRRVNERDLPTE